MNIRDQIADAAIKWARAKEAEASKDERKGESTVLDRVAQNDALQEIRDLAHRVPHRE